MVKYFIIANMLFLFAPGMAGAEEVGGTLNPEEMSVFDSPSKKPSLAVCLGGYLLTKSGNHAPAFQAHRRCAEAGYTRSMIWLAFIYQNGLVPEGENSTRAAYWDRRAAEAGNEVGMFNYGLDLLRGYGVPRDVEAGKRWIERAAEGGYTAAAELIATDFALHVVTPDADEARWALYQ